MIIMIVDFCPKETFIINLYLHDLLFQIVDMVERVINFIDPLRPGVITPVGKMYIKKFK